MINLNDMKQTIQNLGDDTLTLYLHVDNARQENQADNPAWKIELKNMLQEAEQSIISTDSRDDWQHIRGDVDIFFRDYQPTTKSLVIFANAKQMTTYELPIPLPSQGHYGKPVLTPLLWALDEYERYLIVQVDQEKARFISGYLGSASAEGDMEMELEAYDFRQKTLMPANYTQPEGSASAPGGNNRDRFEDMVDEHRQRFYRDVTEHLDELMSEMGNPRLILSGDEQSAHALQEQLSQAQRRYLVGITPAPMNLSENETLDAVMDTALAYERSKELELVNEVINAAKAGGRGALGHADVVQALTEQRVETLVLTYPPADNDLANELKLKAFEQSTSIELVHGTPAAKLEAEGGVGAKLYYAYEANPST